MKIFSFAVVVCALVSVVSCGKQPATDDSEPSVISKPMSGTWSASTGTEDTNGSSQSCTAISITLTFTASTVTVSNGTATCGGSPQPAAPPITLTIAGANLTFNSVVLGTISDSEIHLQYTGSNGSFDADYVLTNPTTMTYSENDAPTGGTFTASATLTHQ